MYSEAGYIVFLRPSSFPKTNVSIFASGLQSCFLIFETLRCFLSESTLDECGVARWQDILDTGKT